MAVVGAGGALYPFITGGLAVGASLALLYEAMAGLRWTAAPWAAVVLGLAFCGLALLW